MEIFTAFSVSFPRYEALFRTVGVFINETFETIMRKAERCHLNAVHLHGDESPELISRLRRESLIVIKGLFIEKSPSPEDAPGFDASAFLIECGKGKLPGGNAVTWNWGDAKDFGEKYPFILAGGLAPENVVQPCRSGHSRWIREKVRGCGVSGSPKL